MDAQRELFETDVAKKSSIPLIQLLGRPASRDLKNGPKAMMCIEQFNTLS
jgi:hypothetical protein